MPVIKVWGYGENVCVSDDLRKFKEKFRLAVANGEIRQDLADEVALVQIYSSASEIISSVHISRFMPIGGLWTAILSFLPNL